MFFFFFLLLLFSLFKKFFVSLFHCFLWIFDNIPCNLYKYPLEFSPESSQTFLEFFRKFHGIFLKIRRIFLKHSRESFRTFPGIFSNIPQNFSGYSPEAFWIFLSFWMLYWWHSTKSSKRLTRIHENITRVSCILWILFPVPSFLVL